MNFANDGWSREVSIEDVSKQERPAILQRMRYVALGHRVAQQVTRWLRDWCHDMDKRC
jgi:hypothetical protein